MAAGGNVVPGEAGADFQRVHLRVLGQCGQPQVVAPTAAQCALLAGDDVVRAFAQGEEQIGAVHHARIEDQGLDVLPGLRRALQRGRDLVQHQGIVVKQLVKAHAAGGAVAVAPENQHVSVSGIILAAILQKG